MATTIDTPFEIVLGSGETFELPQDLTIACDTEFFGPHTLTVQAACRVEPDTIVVQVYSSPAIPPLPRDLDLRAYLPADLYGRFVGRVLVRTGQPITTGLSPASIVQNLVNHPSLRPLSRSEGAQLRIQTDSGWTPHWQVEDVELTLVGCFWTADFFRVFSADFFRELVWSADYDTGSVWVRARKLIQYIERRKRSTIDKPCLGYLAEDPRLHQLKVQMHDVQLPFGFASLDALSQTFLGLRKSEVITAADKANMFRTFRERPHDAYGYAIVDAVNTLLVHEQQCAEDRRIYEAFEMPTRRIPPLRGTVGSRVVDVLMRTTTEFTAKPSKTIGSDRAVKRLARQGGLGLFRSDASASMFGEQTAQVHGGLLYNRSPTRFWHESPGQLRDVDLSGCYNRILAGMNVYWGQPVIFEPGARRMSLAEAVALVRQHADSDAWMVRVTGDITAAPNALIPSTPDAWTGENYNHRRRQRRARTQWRGFDGDFFDPFGHRAERSGAKIYSHRIESGIVTDATWRVIESLPAVVRAEHENLIADSIIFYPQQLVAESGEDFDRLVERLKQGELPWSASLDMVALRVEQVDRLDERFASLRYPIGDYARRIGEFRTTAKANGNRGASEAWKLLGNSMYGALACPDLPANNFLAANIITATGRAAAYVMSQALNAIQTITDGVTYRRDQIPACTFAECLALKPDYSIKRAEAGDGIPFLDPASVPADNHEFTDWYRRHVLNFFSGATRLEPLLQIHDLEHKLTGPDQRPEFDALACDGSGNYLKCRQNTDGQWVVDEMKARSYGRDSKAVLRDWLVETFRSDNLASLPPLTSDIKLLKFKEAGLMARKAIEAGKEEVYYPLGLAIDQIKAYTIIKESAFIFRDNDQRKAIVKQLAKFRERYGCGLELLAMRRSYGGRRQGSIAQIAQEVYNLIRAGETNLTTAFNLSHLSPRLVEVAETRRQQLEQRKQAAQDALFEQIDVNNLPAEAKLTGRYVTRADDVCVDLRPAAPSPATPPVESASQPLDISGQPIQPSLPSGTGSLSLSDHPSPADSL